MNKYYKKFFLNLIFFSIVTSQFTNCESHNSTMVANSAKDGKVICRNKCSQGMAPGNFILLSCAILGTTVTMMCIGSCMISEWREGRKLSFIERELDMINVNLSLLGGMVFGGMLLSSLRDENVEQRQEQNQTTQPEYPCATQV